MHGLVLEINLLSANNLAGGSDGVYARIRVRGLKKRSPVGRQGRRNDTEWDFTSRYVINKSAVKKKSHKLTVKLYRKRCCCLGDQFIGKVRVPIKELHKQAGGGEDVRKVNHAVKRGGTCCKTQVGEIRFSYRFMNAEDKDEESGSCSFLCNLLQLGLQVYSGN